MENQITIQVIGKSNTGKTTISQEIVDLLRTLKFNVEWDATPDHSSENGPRRNTLDQRSRLESVRLNEPKIVVKEVNHIEKY
jgi:uridine kinase